MWRTPAFFLVLVFAAAHPPGAASADIYKWTDKDGKVHFGDRPPADAAEPTEIKVKTEVGPERQPPTDAERRARQQRMLDAYEEDRSLKKEALAKEKAEKEKLVRICAKAKIDLNNMRRASYLYDLDEAGERVIRSDEDRERATREVEAFIAKKCR